MSFNILIIEPYLSLQESLCEWLSTSLLSCKILARADMTEVLDGDIGIPLAVLVDVDDVTNGLIILQKLREIYPETHLFAFGVHDNLTLRRWALQAGANDYLAKHNIDAMLLPALQALL